MICIWDPLPWESVCVCAPDVGGCVLLRGLTDEATGGPATRVCVHLRAECGGWETWFYSGCECLREWSQAGVMTDAKGLTGSFSLTTYRRGCQLWPNRTQHIKKQESVALPLVCFPIRQNNHVLHICCKHPPFFMASPGAACIISFCIKQQTAGTEWHCILQAQQMYKSSVDLRKPDQFV